LNVQDKNIDLSGKGARVETPEGNNLTASFKYEGCIPGQRCNSPPYLYVENKGKRIFYIKVGGFTPIYKSVENAQHLNGDQFTFSSTEKRNVIRYETVRTLNATYIEHYNELKKYFNLPNRVNFDFKFDLPGEVNDIAANRSIPQGIDVKAKQQRVEIMMDDGSIVFGDLIVKAW
jgi:hypothetical protein